MDVLIYSELLKNYDTTYALAPVQDYYSQKWGYITKSGRYVIQPQFELAQEFKNWPH